MKTGPLRKKILLDVETAILANSARRCSLCFYLEGEDIGTGQTLCPDCVKVQRCPEHLWARPGGHSGILFRDQGDRPFRAES